VSGPKPHGRRARALPAPRQGKRSATADPPASAPSVFQLRREGGGHGADAQLPVALERPRSVPKPSGERGQSDVGTLSWLPVGSILLPCAACPGRLASTRQLAYQGCDAARGILLGDDLRPGRPPRSRRAGGPRPPHRACDSCIRTTHHQLAQNGDPRASARNGPKLWSDPAASSPPRQATALSPSLRLPPCPFIEQAHLPYEQQEIGCCRPVSPTQSSVSSLPRRESGSWAI